MTIPARVIRNIVNDIPGPHRKLSSRDQDRNDRIRAVGRSKARGSAPRPRWGLRPQTRASLAGCSEGGPACAVIESESAPLLNILRKERGSGGSAPSGSRAEPWPFFLPQPSTTSNIARQQRLIVPCPVDDVKDQDSAVFHTKENEVITKGTTAQAATFIAENERKGVWSVINT